MTYRYLHYVRHHDIPAWEKLGWVNTGGLTKDKTIWGPCPHGEWSETLEWLGEGEPKYPNKELE